jgi:hypothetical protein
MAKTRGCLYCVCPEVKTDGAARDDGVVIKQSHNFPS